MTAATHIINWQSNALVNKPPLTIIINPEQIEVGVAIKISLFSAYPHKLLSPYDGLGSKSIAVVNDQIEELINLSGSSEITVKFPINQIITLVAELPIVDETSRKIIVDAGLPVNLFLVINQRLVAADKTQKLHGSIKLIYKTFNAQMWRHQAFNKTGNALLFAQNLTTLDEENVPLNVGGINNTTGNAIKILPYPLDNGQTQDYMNVIVFPADKNLIVTTDKGELFYRGKELYDIECAEFTLNGNKIVTLDFIVDDFNKLSGIHGYFFDSTNKHIVPTWHLENGVIVANVDCYGKGFVTYKTWGVIYAYRALIQSIFPVGSLYPSVSVERGTIFAHDPNKAGVAASYEVPESEVIGNGRNNMLVLRVYVEKALTNIGEYEMPPNISSGDCSYPSNIGIPAGNLMKPWGYSTIKSPIESVTANGFYLSSTEHSNNSAAPFVGEVNADRVYKIEKYLPDEDDVNYKLIENIGEMEMMLKAKWGIS